jgi:hypothetical protein
MLEEICWEPYIITNTFGKTALLQSTFGKSAAKPINQGGGGRAEAAGRRRQGGGSRAEAAGRRQQGGC